METQKNLQTVIREYREKRGYSQEELSAAIGKSSKYIGAVECGRIHPPFLVLRKIVRTLAIDANMLFYDDVVDTDEVTTVKICFSRMSDSNKQLAVELLQAMARSGTNQNK